MSIEVTLAAVGDLQLGDSPTTVGFGFFSKYAGVPIDSLLAEASAAFMGADVVFANLETTLVPPAKNEKRRGALQMRGELRFAQDLRNAGFTMLNVANNHAVQHGHDTFHATVAAVRAAGIECCGVRGTGEWTSQPSTVDVRGMRVGFLGYCQRPRQYDSVIPPYAEGTAAEICADVARLRASGTTVVVSLHWGEEFVPHPSADEVDLGRAIIDAGASLILGHHPHVTRPVERYKSGVIAYSLGNFMGDMVWYGPFRTGAVLRCTLGDNVVKDASVMTSALSDDYRPVVSPKSAAEPMVEGRLTGMEAGEYARAIDDTMRRQRLASYRDAVLSIPRTPWPILSQLVTQTISNKLSALRPRNSRRSAP